MDIFVGSLSFKLRESELREAFEKYGKVNSAKIIIDKITRQSKGFGFVEMPDEVEARAAINALNGADMYGRPLVVNESQKREPRGDNSAPRPDTRNGGGFNRPRPTGNDTTGNRGGYQTEDRNTGRDYTKPASLDDDEPDDDDASAKTAANPAARNPATRSPAGRVPGDRSSLPDRGFAGGVGGSNFRSADKQRDKGHHDRDHNRNQGGRPKVEDRYNKKGGGGSKDYGRRINDDDDW
ncbi:RNA-binding protein [Dyadobacter sp. CY261]|uniref:RNA recognition motif domain-containing protein n=1 Tax=Dyadobacter sp. CY261 TaxID=2907203 RepID=UPI001F39031D|nr:RNA-binding protein [Dyadobacter sp. CY261]MCF0074764.1 RNA-binding protein [Dyadobacter sp. CY261]